MPGIGISIALPTSDPSDVMGGLAVKERQETEKFVHSGEGYRLEVSEYVRATTIMIKLLHENATLNHDERKMIRNALALMQAVFDDWHRKHPTPQN